MRWCFAVALSAVLGLGLYTYWASSHENGLRYSASFKVDPDSHLVGGLSGIEVTQNGRALVAIGDRGVLFRAVLSRGPDGVLEGVRWSEDVLLSADDGTPLLPENRDSEGLVLSEDGSVLISFEGQHRVVRYDMTGALVAQLPVPLGFQALQSNSGLEALALSPEGQLLTLPERSGAMSRPFPLFVYSGENWEQSAAVPRRGAFLPVGADFGPNGAFYLLERDYFLSGFRSRVRRFRWENGRLSNEEVLLLTRFWQHDNLEGISVWQAPDGQTRLTMVSDNNFNPLQTSELVEYVLTAP